MAYTISIGSGYTIRLFFSSFLFRFKAVRLEFLNDQEILSWATRLDKVVKPKQVVYPVGEEESKISSKQVHQLQRGPCHFLNVLFSYTVASIRPEVSSRAAMLDARDSCRTAWELMNLEDPCLF